MDLFPPFLARFLPFFFLPFPLFSCPNRQSPSMGMRQRSEKGGIKIAIEMTVFLSVRIAEWITAITDLIFAYSFNKKDAH